MLNSFLKRKKKVFLERWFNIKAEVLWK